MKIYAICDYWEDTQIRLFSITTHNSIGDTLDALEKRKLTWDVAPNKPTHFQIFELKGSYENTETPLTGAAFPNV
jgi:hypothetical protein